MLAQCREIKGLLQDMWVGGKNAVGRCIDGGVTRGDNKAANQFRSFTGEPSNNLFTTDTGKMQIAYDDINSRVVIVTTFEEHVQCALSIIGLTDGPVLSLKPSFQCEPNPRLVIDDQDVRQSNLHET